MAPPYDPVKAHQYYIRNRHLKGRRAGQGTPVTSPRSHSPSYDVRTLSGKTVTLSGRELAERKAYAAKRIGHIKRRLAELNTLLRKSMADAKAKKNVAEKKASTPKTAVEKSKAAREAKKYQDTHKQEIATKRHTVAAKQPKTKVVATTTKSKKKDHVAELETKINEVKNKLTLAVANQRSLFSATRNG